MAVARVLACVALIASCRDRDEPARAAPDKPAVPSTGPAEKPAPDTVTGSIVVDGATLTPTGCRVGREAHLFVEAITPRGTLRFANAQLVWNNTLLACTKLDRSWGGGSRTNGTHYWRGMLDFVCGPVTEASEAVRPSRARDGTITGKLELECGGVTATERAQLDANREKSRDRQRD